MTNHIESIPITSFSEGMKTTSSFGSHQIITDEPHDFGGKNEAANPMATLLASLAGCENATAMMIAKEMGMSMDSLQFEITGELDLRGLQGDPHVDPYFQNIDIRVKVNTNEEAKKVEELKNKVHARCPAYTLLKAANIPINSSWTKA